MPLDPSALGIVAALLGGGGVSAWLVARVNRGTKQDELLDDRMKSYTEGIREDLQAVKVEARDLMARVRTLEGQVRDLQRDLDQSQARVAALEREKASLESEVSLRTQEAVNAAARALELELALATEKGRSAEIGRELARLRDEQRGAGK